MDIKEVTFLLCTFVITNYAKLLFNLHDMEKSASQLVDLDIDVYDVWVIIEPH
jgi:hypothetical protein